MKTKLGIILPLFLTFCLSVAKGESPHIFHLDHKDGLSSRYIRSIRQDARGFVWVATGDGLNRFDGLRFTGFTKENSGLPSNQVNDVIADPSDKDRVWIATRNDGMAVYDYSTGKIESRKDVASSLDIPHFAPASGDRIWIVNYHFPPDLFDPASGKTERIYTEAPEGLPGRFWCASESPSGNELYVGHDGGGFTIINLKTGEFVNHQHDEKDSGTLLGDYVYSIHVDDTGMVWLGTDRGLSVYNPADGTFRNVVYEDRRGGLLPGAIWSILEVSNGDMWFATSLGGVSVLRAGNIPERTFEFESMTPATSLDPRSNISSSYIFSLYEDSYGNIWIGNLNDGIDVISYAPPFFRQEAPFPFRGISRPHQSVWSTAIDKSGNLWIGGEDEIMQMGNFYPRRYTLPTMEKGYNALVKGLCCGRDGKIWIGTSNSGIFIFDPSAGRMERVEMAERDIRHIMEDTDGSFLISTKNGLYRSRDGKRAVPDDSLNRHIEDNEIITTVRDNAGNLWIGTLGCGVYVFSGKKNVRQIDRSHGLPSNTVNAVMPCRNGKVWIATREGAVMLDGKSLEILKVINGDGGLVNSNVKSVQEDINGDIWLATNKGVGHYSPVSDRLSVYTRTFGSDLNSMTENSACVNGHNRIFFGSLDGLIFFNPMQTPDPSLESKIMLSKIIAHDAEGTDHSLEIDIPVNRGKVTLPHNMNTFTLSFSDPDITRSANSDYRYNLKGVNEVWTVVNHENEAVYRNLKPGEYEFQISHRLNGQEWSAPMTLATITITPPLYLTWWAKMVYVLTAILIVTAIVSFYKHKLDLEQKLTIERENRNNNIRLNDERMMFFTNITHELRTPLSLIVGPIEDLVNDTDMKSEHRRKLLTIRTSSMRLLNLINGILEFRKTETGNRRLEVVEGNLANFVREIGLRFKELNSNRDVNVMIDVAEMEDVTMYYDPEIITTALNNLISNALKCTGEGKIEVSLRPVSEGGVDYAELSVEDTGEGISADALPHIFKRYYQASHNRKISGTGIGLALTKSLVELHEGTISVVSEVGKGSKFTIRLIISNSYPNAVHKEVGDPGGGNEAEDKSIGEASVTNKLTLLVVEDDKDLCEYIAQSFAEEFRVICANDGKEGLELARKEFPDVIVSDIMMPVMDGIELCRTVKEDPSVSHIPVILLTAKDSLLDREKGYDSGADSYITKPFSTTLLKSRINNIMESRHKMSLRMMEIAGSPADGRELQDHVEEMPDDGEKEMASLTPFDREFVNKFKTLVEDNLEKEEMDIAFFTDKMCMSHSTLYRKVKSITGFTPNEFIRKIKLRRASELLKGGAATVSDVAYMTGFSNPAYFRRVFKKEYGMSPTEYLQQKNS